MSLQRYNDSFQPGYYLVGTGVVRMPAHGTGYLSDGPCKEVAFHLRPLRREEARPAIGSSGWLVRLFGHVKRLPLLFDSARKR